METEKRLIDANELVDEVLNHPKPYRRDFYRMLKEAPTVDAVQVVRCKDCWKSAEGLCSYQLKNVPGKDFCGDGERKDNERKAD